MKRFLPALVLGLAAAAPAQGDLPSDREEIFFDVYRGDSRFGEHRVRFEQAGEDLRVEVDINLRVNFGPINFFRYEHEAEELWRDGQLLSLQTETLEDGDRVRITAQRDGSDFRVTNSSLQQAVALSGSLPPSSHWQGYEVGQESIFNTVTGEEMPVTISYIGRETIEADGRMIEADRYRMTGTLTVDLWYDEDGVWAKCYFEIDGQRISYVRRAA